MSLKELPAELRDMTVLRHRSEKGYKGISAALKSTVASITLKWKKREPGLFVELAA